MKIRENDLNGRYISGLIWLTRDMFTFMYRNQIGSERNSTQHRLGTVLRSTRGQTTFGSHDHLRIRWHHELGTFHCTFHVVQSLLFLLIIAPLYTL